MRRSTARRLGSRAHPVLQAQVVAVAELAQQRVSRGTHDGTGSRDRSVRACLRRRRPRRRRRGRSGSRRLSGRSTRTRLASARGRPRRSLAGREPAPRPTRGPASPLGRSAQPDRNRHDRRDEKQRQPCPDETAGGGEQRNGRTGRERKARSTEDERTREDRKRYRREERGDDRRCDERSDEHAAPAITLRAPPSEQDHESRDRGDEQDRVPALPGPGRGRVAPDRGSRPRPEYRIGLPPSRRAEAGGDGVPPSSAAPARPDDPADHGAPSALRRGPRALMRRGDG